DASNSFAEVKSFNDKHISKSNLSFGQNFNNGVSPENPNGYQSVSDQYGKRNDFASNLNYPAGNLYGANKQTWQELQSGRTDSGNMRMNNAQPPLNNGGAYNDVNYQRNGYGQSSYGMQNGYQNSPEINVGFQNSAVGNTVNPAQYGIYPQPQQFGGINYNWTPNGYVPVQPVPFVQPNVIYQPVQVIPANVSGSVAANNVQTVENKQNSMSGGVNSGMNYDELKPLQSSNFTLNPNTGVYSNPHNTVDSVPKTYAPDLQRGKQLNIEAEARRQSEDIKRDRLKRMEELKRRQAERNAKRNAEENAQNTASSASNVLKLDEYSAAVERGRINAEVLKPNPSDNRIVTTSAAESFNGENRWHSVGESNMGISAEEKARRGFGAFAGKVGGFGGGNSLRTEATSVDENSQKSGFGVTLPSGNASNVNEKDDYPEFENDRIVYRSQNEIPSNVALNAISNVESERDAEAERIEAERAKYLERHNKKKGKNEDPKVRTAQITIEESIEKTEPRAPYVAPPIDLLVPPEIKTGPGEDIEEKKEALISTLAYFNVKAKIVDVVCGPAFSLFRLMIEEMPRGKTINWLQSLENDLAMKMAEISVKILTPIPGENLVGVEVSNKNRRMVRISSILKSAEFENAKTPVSFALGEDIYGKNYVCEVRSLPHMLVAGQTGAGKSCCINTLIVSMLFHASPDDVRFIMIDPKRTELSIYKGIPHLLLDDIIYDADKAIKALQWGIEEMQRRIEFFNKNGYRDIEEYNACKLEDDFVPMPRIVIIIDELAELMDRGSKTVESCIDRLARLARAVGIHLICATQRPSVDVVSGTIKNNLTSRIAFRVPTQGDSRTVLGVGGAENLLGDGDLLYMNPKLKSSVRMQGAFISTAEVKAVVDFLKMHNTCVYDSKIKEEIYKEDEKEEPQSENNGSKKQSAISQELIDALRIGLEGVPLSISMLQRKLGVGFPKAGKIYDQIERMGYFGPPAKPNGARPVTITKEEYDELVAEFEGEDE
ncbi:MAG: DNA translocase FtsK, partial [Christensenellales bacterium]